jgi:hypothetical protein
MQLVRITVADAIDPIGLEHLQASSADACSSTTLFSFDDVRLLSFDSAPLLPFDDATLLPFLLG